MIASTDEDEEWRAGVFSFPLEGALHEKLCACKLNILLEVGAAFVCCTPFFVVVCICAVPFRMLYKQAQMKTAQL